MNNKTIFSFATIGNYLLIYMKLNQSNYITICNKKPTTDKPFAMFFKNDFLQLALNEYKAQNHDNN